THRRCERAVRLESTLHAGASRWYLGTHLGKTRLCHAASWLGGRIAIASTRASIRACQDSHRLSARTLEGLDNRYHAPQTQPILWHLPGGARPHQDSEALGSL